MYEDTALCNVTPRSLVET